jgi:2-polyprenyl-3-methyl-5-hydroxy-6-metoxy-1,4-benzoquinol methylase
VSRAPHAERFLPEQMHGELIEAEHLVRYLWAAAYTREREVLDAGCGAGYGTRILLDHGAKRCVGVDLSEEAVHAARERYGGNGEIEFEAVDISKLPFEDDAFDAAVCMEALEHVSDQASAVQELRRVLRPGSVLLVSSPNRGEYPPGNPHHARELSAQEFIDLLSREFSHVVPSRQHTWLASAILGDDDFSRLEPERPLEAALHKAAMREPGKELYTLAICSDEPPPEPSQAVMMTHPLEVRRWLEQIESARSELLRQGDELRRTRETLAAAERELLEVRDRSSKVVARAESRTYWLDRANIDLDRLVQRPWVRAAYRALRALRSLKARVRRLMSRVG